MSVREMLNTHPMTDGQVSDAVVACIEQCFRCGSVCASCADACLGEEMVASLRRCIQLNLDCAVICLATGQVAIRRTSENREVLMKMIDACARACAACGEECARHAESHEHCRVCADECHRCEDACREALTLMQ